MPLYICTTKPGVVPQDVKQPIANAITEIHCTLTNAPRTFVHVFFMENDDVQDIQLFGSVRAGRTDETKAELVKQMREATADLMSIDLDKVSMATQDVPSKWVMEGGDLLPEPGEEEEWLIRHNAKMAEMAKAG